MFITVATAAEIGRGIVENFSSVSVSNQHSEVGVCVVLVGYRKKQNDVVNINTSMPIDIPYSFS